MISIVPGVPVVESMVRLPPAPTFTALPLTVIVLLPSMRMVGGLFTVVVGLLPENTTSCAFAPVAAARARGATSRMVSTPRDFL